jgi:hypothetical protein
MRNVVISLQRLELPRSSAESIGVPQSRLRIWDAIGSFVRADPGPADLIPFLK